MKRPRYNRIHARGVIGIYKDQYIEIIIGETAQKSKIIVNGKEIKGVFGAHIHIREGRPTELILEKYK